MKDFLSISVYSPAEIQDVLDLAVKLKKERKSKPSWCVCSEWHIG